MNMFPKETNIIVMALFTELGRQGGLPTIESIFALINEFDPVNGPQIREKIEKALRDATEAV